MGLLVRVSHLFDLVAREVEHLDVSEREELGGDGEEALLAVRKTLCSLESGFPPAFDPFSQPPKVPFQLHSQTLLDALPSRRKHAHGVKRA